MSYISLPVARVSSSKYEISYVAFIRGKHKLHIKVNNIDLRESPFIITVYPDPRQYQTLPVRIIDDLKDPSSIIVKDSGEVIVSEARGDKISVIKGKSKRIIQNKYTVAVSCVVTDGDGNFYFTREHRLVKLNHHGDFITQIGSKISGSGLDEFNDPRGVTLYKQMLYVCDSANHRIQVFDLNLNYIKTIGSKGNGDLQFGGPYHVNFDSTGNMYVAERENNRIQLIDSREEFVNVFGKKGKVDLEGPSSLAIVDRYVYVADWFGHSIAVYDTSGVFIASFGKRGNGTGEFEYSYCVTVGADGYIYVCDFQNKKVQIF